MPGAPGRTGPHGSSSLRLDLAEAPLEAAPTITNGAFHNDLHVAQERLDSVLTSRPPHRDGPAKLTAANRPPPSGVPKASSAIDASGGPLRVASRHPVGARYVVGRQRRLEPGAHSAVALEDDAPSAFFIGSGGVSAAAPLTAIEEIGPDDHAACPAP